MTVNRRQFMMTGAMSAAVFSGGAAWAQAGNKTLRIAVQKISAWNTLHPMREQSTVGDRIFYPNVWEQLISRNLRGSLEAIPRLATEWSRIDDRTIELKLREGVIFHNGDEMTADDVAFTFSAEAMFGDTQPASRQTVAVTGRAPSRSSGKELPADVPGNARRCWPDLLSVTAVDRYRVRFENASSDPSLEGKFLQMGSDIISRRSWEEAASYLEWARNPVATGPYKVSSFEPEIELVLTAHDAYWGGKPPLDEIRFIEVPEISSRINGLLSGEYDMACDIPSDLLSEVEADERFECVGGPIANIRMLNFDTKHPILADPNVRRAMIHAIDREGMVNALWNGRSRVPNGLQFPSFGQMYIEDWENSSYDPDLARELLKKTSYNGEPIQYRLMNNYYPNQMPLAQIMVEMWQAVGLNVELHIKESWSQIYENDGHRAIRDGSKSAAYGDPISMIVGVAGANSRLAQIGEWENAEATELFATLETSMDPDLRRNAARRLLEICEKEDPVYMVLHQTTNFVGKKKSIKWNASEAFAMDFAPGGIEL